MELVTTAASKGQTSLSSSLRRILIAGDRHLKADCTNPRKTTGLCHVCNEEGHQARDCENKPCFNCKQKGHTAGDCTNKRVLDTDGIPSLNADEAWEKLLEADKTEDLDDVREVRGAKYQLLAQTDPDLYSLGYEGLQQSCTRLDI